MFANKIERDIGKLNAKLTEPNIIAGLAQLDDEAAEDLVLGVIEGISDDIVLEGIGFDRPRGASVNWSHKSGGGLRTTYVSFIG